MADPSVTIHIELSGLRRFQSEIDSQLRGDSDGPVADAIRQWGFRARAFLQERYETYSRGGGDWAPLAESTKQRRRNKDKDSIAILIDTGLLVGALNPLVDSAPGALNRRIPFGIVIGYGGGDSHGRDKATIADIATYHQTGTRIMPARPIVVPPSEEVQQMMVADLERGIARLTEQLS